MKKHNYYALASLTLLCCMALTTSFTSTARAQDGVQIIPYYGWQWGGDISTYEGEIEFDAEDSFGGMIDIPVSVKNSMVELSYIRQNTNAYLNRYASGRREDLFPVSIEYFQAGGVYEQRYSQGKVAPFGLTSLGAVRMAPQHVTYDDYWAFAITVGVGIKTYLSDRLGLRVQIKAEIPLLFSSGGVWCGTGGCSAGISGTGTIQGNVGGGLIFVL